MASIMFALFNVSDTIAIFGIAVFVIFTMLSLIYTKIDRLVEKRFPDSYMMSKEKEYDTKYKRANMEDKERLKLTTEAISRIRFDLSRKLELFIISIVSSIISIILFLIFVDTLSLSLISVALLTILIISLVYAYKKTKKFWRMYWVLNLSGCSFETVAELYVAKFSRFKRTRN